MRRCGLCARGEKSRHITPVPGGVGLMTRAMLMKKSKAARLQSGL